MRTQTMFIHYRSQSRSKMGFGLKDLKQEDQLTDAQHKQFAQVFKSLDRDNSGRIDAAELGTLLKKLNIEVNAAALDMIVQFSSMDGTPVSRLCFSLKPVGHRFCSRFMRRNSIFFSLVFCGSAPNLKK